jgi:hypothetical protein
MYVSNKEMDHLKISNNIGTDSCVQQAVSEWSTRTQRWKNLLNRYIQQVPLIHKPIGMLAQALKNTRYRYHPIQLTVTWRFSTARWFSPWIFALIRILLLHLLLLLLLPAGRLEALGEGPGVALLEPGLAIKNPPKKTHLGGFLKNFNFLWK